MQLLHSSADRAINGIVEVMGLSSVVALNFFQTKQSTYLKLFAHYQDHFCPSFLNPHLLLYNSFFASISGQYFLVTVFYKI